jgi:tetratricopeptide (TPR) repeat protein
MSTINEQQQPAPTTSKKVSQAMQQVLDRAALQGRQHPGPTSDTDAKANKNAASLAVATPVSAAETPVSTPELPSDAVERADEAHGLIGRAQIYAEAGMRENATRYALRAVQLQQNLRLHLDALHILATVQADREAVTLARQISVRDPANANVLLVLVDVYERNHLPARAAIALKKLLLLKPNDRALRARLRKLESQI